MEWLGANVQVLSRDGADSGPKATDIGECFVVVPYDLSGRQVLVTFGCVCVFDQDDRVPERESPASCGVYAELGVHAADDKIADRVLPKNLLQFRAVERVWRCLSYAYVSWLDMKPAGELPLMCSEFEVARL